MKTITTTENRTYKRVSNWIEIKYQYVTKRHSLSGYADFYGTDDKNIGSLSYFRYKNKLYAIGQFMRLSAPEYFENEDGKQSFLWGYDCTSFYNPLLCEIDDCGENIRLFEEVTE